MKMYAFLPALGAALGLALAIPAAAQEHSTQWRTKPREKYSYDDKQTRRAFADYTKCVVDNRYERARSVALAPYASDQQGKALQNIVRTHNDPCIRGFMDNVQMQFSTPVLAGGVAQALVVKDYPDLPRLVAGFTIDPAQENAQLAGLNAAEIFGRCVVQRDPASVLRLLASRPATPEEVVAINSLRDDLGPCLAAGSKLTINEMFLRNVTAVAAYRFAQQIQPRGGASGGAA
jgi:hypothetical protein